MEDIDVVRNSFCHDEELSVRAKGQRGSSCSCGSEECCRAFDLLQLAAEIELEAYEAACSTAIQDIDEAAVFGDR